MTLVRIIKNWNWPDLLRQTPGGHGAWAGIQFTEDALIACDYAVILNTPASQISLTCSPQHIWALMQEPPNEHFSDMHRGQSTYARIYTSQTRLKGERYIYSQPALPWHINRDYDYLKACSIPEKKRQLSWITSNKTAFSGHRARMGFLKKIQPCLDFDLFGYGFRPIEDKWNGVAPYRYSFAIENFRNDYYWSEKLTDCFLSWTMPIYYGANKITDYFPPESMILVDIYDPDALDVIRAAISENRWEKNLDAIAEARRKVLDEYQIFPFVVRQILEHQPGCHCQLLSIRLSPYQPSKPGLFKIQDLVSRIFRWSRLWIKRR